MIFYIAAALYLRLRIDLLQVLITVPECLEKILLSTDEDVRAVAAKIKYVIFDEVGLLLKLVNLHFA